MDDNNNFCVHKIDLEPIQQGIPKCNVLITNLECSDPKYDDKFYVIVSYSVTNETDKEWGYFESRCQLLNAKGMIVEESCDASEVDILPGETETFKMIIWIEDHRCLGDNPDKLHVTLFFTACTFLQQHIGKIKTPATPFEVSPINPTKIGNILTLVTGNVSREDEFFNKEDLIKINLLMQNHTLSFFPVVELFAPIKDRKNRIFKIHSSIDEIRPASITTISSQFHTKQKRLINSELDITLNFYWQVATGITQKHGATTIIKNSNDDNLDYFV